MAEIRPIPTAACPACGQSAPVATQQALRQERIVLPWFATYTDLVRDTVSGVAADAHSNRTRIHWACDACIAAGRALLAESARQRFLDCWPYYAYSDDQIVCRDCGQEFTFARSEQRHWYEALSFWVQSRPVRCKPCQLKRKTTLPADRRPPAKSFDPIAAQSRSLEYALARWMQVQRPAEDHDTIELAQRWIAATTRGGTPDPLADLEKRDSPLAAYMRRVLSMAREK